MSKRVRLARLLQEGSLYAILLLLPFSKAVVELGFGFMLVGWCLERTDPAWRKATVWLNPALQPLIWAVAAFLFVCFLSVFVSRFPSLSMKGLIEKWAEYLLFFIFAADIGCRPRVAQRSIKVLAVSSVLVVVEALTQVLFDRGLLRGFRYRVFERATGPYENPIDLATYLMVIIPVVLVFVLMLRRGMGPRILGWLLVGALVVLFAQTDALGPWLGFAMGMVLFLFLASKVRSYGFIVLAVTLSTAALMPAGHGVETPHTKEAFSIAQLGMQDRWLNWQAAVGMIQDQPLLGHGLNTFMANYLDYWVGGERQPRYAHNCYLQVAAETGLIGLSAFLALLGFLFWTLFRGLRRVESSFRLPLVAYMGGLLAFVLHAGIDTNFYSLRQAVLFWVLAGLAIGLTVSQPAPLTVDR
ncbi:MAG: O-antigen ligase family protein [Candidatus Omnitrophica bacterium]|nr:O-antigen ligase family protein [Candidatus Omnitrophota bacterium]MBI3010641.1 O-antigen ligase family protein [Candidatus Omnitrophota bacterium]